MLSKSFLQASYLLAAVLAACLGQFILRIRPSADGVRITGLYIMASLACYAASFGITSLVMPIVDRKIAVLVLSLQYPLLYILFAAKDSAAVSPASLIAIIFGYAIVAVAMSSR